jgi:hypothetical protein
MNRATSKGRHGDAIAEPFGLDRPLFRHRPRHFASIARRGLAKRRTGKHEKRRCRLPTAHFVSKKRRVLSCAPPRKLSARKNRVAKPQDGRTSRRNRVARSARRYVVRKNGE